MRIFHKMLLSFLSIALIIWFVGFFAIFSSQKTLESNVRSEALFVARDLMAYIDRDIYFFIERLERRTKELDVQKAVRASNLAFEQMKDPESYINEEDAAWKKTPSEMTTPFMKNLLENSLSENLRHAMQWDVEDYGFPIFGEIFITNRFGVNIAQTGRTSDYRQNDEAWWQGAWEKGWETSDVEYDESAGVYALNLALRIDDDQGKPIGVVKAVLDIREIFKKLKNSESRIRYRSAQLYLLDEHVKFIYPQDRFGQPAGKIFEAFFLDDGFAALVLQKEKGKEYLYAHAHSLGYMDYKGSHWCLVLRYDADEVFVPVRKIAGTLLMTAGVATLLAILLGLIFSRTFSSTLDKLKQAAERFAKGDFKARINLKSQDEFGQVARSYENMAAQLQTSMASIKTLEEQIDQRLRAEEALRLSEAQLREAQRVSHVGNWVLDLQTEQITFSEEMFRIYGMNPEGPAPTFQKCKKMTHPEDWEKMMTAIRKSKETGGDYELELRMTRLDGEPRVIISRAHVQRDAQGKSARLVGISQDITERKKAEDQLKDSEERLKILFEYAPDAYYIFDLQGTLLDGNKAAEAATGYKRGELVGKNFLKISLLPLSEAPKTMAVLAKSALGQPCGPVEFLTNHKDGAQRIMEVRTHPIKIKEKTVVMGCARDITERKQFQERLSAAHDDLEKRVRERTAELAKSQSYIRKIVSTITDYIYTVNVKDGKVVSTEHEPTCYGVTGYMPEEFVEKPDLWLEMVYEEDRPAVRDHAAALLRGKEPPTIEHRIVRKDGEIRWIRNTPVLHHNAKGDLISYDGIVRDITQSKQAQEDLIQAKKQAEEASKVKGQFLANMSHEIRTPLSALIGFAELLDDTSLNPIQKDYVDTLRRSGEALRALVSDILDFSKIEAREIRLEKIDFDLEYLLNSVIKIIGPKIRSERVTLFASIAADMPCWYKGDPTRIRQILINLLSNAIKFTEQGEIEVSVELVNEESASGVSKGLKTIKMTVRDTGIGIAKEKQQSIFDAFEQADISTTRKYGGTGLGLSICKALAEMMGGKMSVVSDFGKGSVFSFTIRLEEAKPLVQKDVWLLAAEQLHGKKILIADDHEKMRQILAIYCRSMKMEVMHESPNAQDALDWLAQADGVPDLLLGNIMMPGMDGFEMARQIRQKKRYETMKMIAVTGSANPGASQKAHEAGFDGYLPKPVIKSDLLAIVQTVLGDKRGKTEGDQILTRHSAEELIYKGLKILVVEDNTITQKLLSVVLGNLGCEIDMASNGEVAVEKVRANAYDLVLMDLQMPVMGGCETTRIIRDKINPTIPIIALTAAALKEDQEMSAAAGMNDFIVKPIEINKLKEKIKQWVKK